MTSVVIETQEDLVLALRRRRAELRWSASELDRKAGLAAGETQRLEHPHTRSGRASLRLNPMAVLWLDALGLQLALRPKPPAGEA